jgi:hypothetical protein
MVYIYNSRRRAFARNVEILLSGIFIPTNESLFIIYKYLYRCFHIKSVMPRLYWLFNYTFIGWNSLICKKKNSAQYKIKNPSTAIVLPKETVLTYFSTSEVAFRSRDSAISSTTQLSKLSGIHTQQHHNNKYRFLCISNTKYS